MKAGHCKSRIMKQTILTLLLILTQVTLMAQTRITGQLLDAQGEGLTGANIYLEGTYDGTTSNLEGQFILESSETGEQVLRIEYIGFKGFQKPLVLQGGTIDLSQITLKEELNELTAVTITAGTFEAGDKKKSIALSSIDMVTTDGSSGDVYGALQALPGTTTVGESGRLVCERGGTAGNPKPSLTEPSSMYPTAPLLRTLRSGAVSARLCSAG
jgi:hypothetical protein